MINWADASAIAYLCDVLDAVEMQAQSMLTFAELAAAYTQSVGIVVNKAV